MSFHARLSASSAERWMNCAGSVNLGTGNEPTSLAAATGTLAHSMAAEYITTGHQPFDFGVQLGDRFKVEGHSVVFDETMWDSIVVYVAEVTRIKRKQWWVELNLHDALKQWDEDLGGTADFATYEPKSKELWVLDFKNGSGVFVSADDNKQLKTYALGTMLAIGKPVEQVHVGIVQPNFEGAEAVRYESFPAVELLDFAGDIAEAAIRTRQPDAPLTAGTWCKKTFCPHAASCPALEKLQHALVKADAQQIVAYNPTQLAEALSMVPLVKERIKAIEEEAYRRATAGEQVPGYKLVDKRPRRHWTDTKAVIAWAEERAINPFHAPELKSPAQMEKGMKAAEKRELAQFTAAVSSGSTLVPESDNRPAISKQISVDDFPELDGQKAARIPATIDNLFE